MKAALRLAHPLAFDATEAMVRGAQEYRTSIQST
jgi:hypothetical protein